MTVAEVNALLYLRDHPRDQLERALRIRRCPRVAGVVRGVAAKPGLPLARRATRVSRRQRLRIRLRLDFVRSRFRGSISECVDVISLTMESRRMEGGWRRHSPGQFVVLRLRPSADGPPLFRSYSLSGPPSDKHYRVSVKVEPNGVAGHYLRDHVRTGDVLDVSEPRGSFTLQPGDGPVVLLSAGIGATPVLAMLHALAAARSPREVWWLHGARNRQVPFFRR